MPSSKASASTCTMARPPTSASPLRAMPARWTRWKSARSTCHETALASAARRSFRGGHRGRRPARCVVAVRPRHRGDPDRPAGDAAGHRAEPAGRSGRAAPGPRQRRPHGAAGGERRRRPRQGRRARPRQVVAPYLSHRFSLLSDADRTALAAPDFDPAQALSRHLNEPFAATVGIALQDDPFGWLQHWMDGQPWSRSALMPEDNLLSAHRDDRNYVLVTATLDGSSYDDSI